MKFQSTIKMCWVCFLLFFFSKTELLLAQCHIAALFQLWQLYLKRNLILTHLMQQWAGNHSLLSLLELAQGHMLSLKKKVIMLKEKLKYCFRIMAKFWVVAVWIIVWSLRMVWCCGSLSIVLRLDCITRFCPLQRQQFCWLFCIKFEVLDPRTRMILFKMLTRGVISEINGCISTGKEVSFLTSDIIVFFSAS